MSFARPPTAFNAAHPARTNSSAAVTGGGLVSREQKMQAELGLDEADFPPDEDDLSSGQEDSGDESDRVGPLDARVGSASAKPPVPPSLGAVGRNTSFSSSLSRSVTGSGFGDAKKRTGHNPGTADDDGAADAAGYQEAPGPSAALLERLYKEALKDRDEIAAEKAQLEQRLTTAMSIPRNTMQMLRKMLLDKIRERDAVLQGFVDRVKDLESRIAGLAGAAATAILPASSKPLSELMHTTLAKQRTETESVESRSQSVASASGLGGTVPGESLASQSLPDSLEVAQTELMAARAEAHALRTAAAVTLTQLHRMKDLRREVEAALPQLPHDAPAKAVLQRSLPAATTAETATALEGLDFGDLLTAWSRLQALSSDPAAAASASAGASGDAVTKHLQMEVARERAKLEDAKRQLTSMLKVSEDSKTAMQKAIAERDELTAKLSAAADERERYRKKLQELASERDTLRASMQAMKQELDAMQTSDAEVMTALQAKVAAAAAERDQLQARVDALQKDVVAARAAGDTGATTAQARVAELAQQLTAVQGNVATLTAQRQTAEAESAGLRSVIEDLRRDLEKMRATAEKGGADTANVQRELHAANQSIAALKQQLATAVEAEKRTRADAEGASATSSTATAELQQKLSQKVTEVASVQSTLEARDRDLAAARKEISDLRAQNAATSTAAAENEGVTAGLRAKVLALESTIAELQASNTRLQEEFRAATANADGALVRVKEDLARAVQAEQANAQKREEALRQEHVRELDASAAKHSAETSQLRAQHDAELTTMKTQMQSLATMSSRVAGVVAGASKAAGAIRTVQTGLRADLQTNMNELQQLIAASQRQLAARVLVHQDAVSTLFARYKKELAERRKLHNMVQELRGNIRVYCRARPVLPFELEAGAKVATSYPAEGEITVVNSKRQAKTWEFDVVFPPAAGNDEVFRETEPLITSSMDGYNVCIFAYGQTGSGKTYTMEGTESSRGVNYRAMETLFGLRDERRGEWSYDISMSMLEIYNEAIQDMLAARAAPGGDVPKLVVREGPQGNFVPDLVIKSVETLDDVLKLMRFGYKNRTTFATNMNEHSSRSHCMVSFYITGTNATTGSNVRGKLHLIDLAGSERVGKSGVTGDRLREAQAINKSLSALGDVIQARAEKRGHVPYRNSTLTWLLSDSLSGDSKTLMFVNMSPILSNAEETFCSLNFAARVRSVELGKATKHVSAGAKPVGPASAARPGSDLGSEDGEDLGSADGSVEDLVDDGVETPAGGAAAMPGPPTPSGTSSPARNFGMPPTPRGSTSGSATARSGKPPAAAGPPSGPVGGSIARRMLAGKK